MAGRKFCERQTFHLNHYLTLKSRAPAQKSWAVGVVSVKELCVRLRRLNRNYMFPEQACAHDVNWGTCAVCKSIQG